MAGMAMASRLIGAAEETVQKTNTCHSHKRDCAKIQYSFFLTPLAPLVRGELSDKSP